MSSARNGRIRACLLVSTVLVAIMVVRCGTPGSGIIPPSNDEVESLIMQHDRPLGFQAVTTVPAGLPVSDSPCVLGVAVEFVLS
jgi:hypothetical protein